MAPAEKAIREEARRFLVGEGLKGAKVHAVDRVADGVWWVAYVRKNKAHTAIVAGSKKDWTLLETLAGWPPPP